MNFGATFNTASSRHDRCAYKEQLEALHLEQSNLNDLLNYSAIIIGDCSPLLSSLIKENDRCSMKIADLVSAIHALDIQYSIWWGEGGSPAVRVTGLALAPSGELSLLYNNVPAPIF